MNLYEKEIIERLLQVDRDMALIDTSDDVYTCVIAGGSAYRINFPENYLERIVKVNIPTKKVNFYTLSLEDLVVSKLCAMRGKDIEDIENESVYNPLDWDLLDRLVDDVCYGMLTDFDKNILLEHYKDYKERFK